MSDRRRIVAEVSVTWQDGDSKHGLLAQRFEDVIAVNWARGYALESWQLSQSAIPASAYIGAQLVELVIAVFVQPDEEP